MIFVHCRTETFSESLGISKQIKNHNVECSASHRITIATTVIYFVLQTTPTHVNEVTGNSEVAPHTPGGGTPTNLNKGVQQRFLNPSPI